MAGDRFRAIASTTHVDRQGDRVSRAALEGMAADFRDRGVPMLSYWNHQTTLPPIWLVTHQYVERRDDGEYQLVAEGQALTEDDFSTLAQRDLAVPQLADESVAAILESTRSLPILRLEISYDPANFDSDDVDPVIDSINELVPATQEHYMRKGEAPQVVIWVALMFATGFVSRLGEVTADKTLEMAESLWRRLSEQVWGMLKRSKQALPGDVIVHLAVPGSATNIEGAVEDVDEVTLRRAWAKLPELRALAVATVEQNRKNYFLELKYLFNPSKGEWEINYLVTRATQQVILGPRYYDESHPLRARWEQTRSRFRGLDTKGMGVSIGFKPIR